MAITLQLPNRPDDAEARMRMGRHVDRWRRAAFSADRADRPAAEEAIRALYAMHGGPVPRIVWVSSPVAGALTYLLASGPKSLMLDPDQAGTGDDVWDRVTPRQRPLFGFAGRHLRRPVANLQRLASREELETLARARHDVARIAFPLRMQVENAVQAAVVTLQSEVRPFTHRRRHELLGGPSPDEMRHRLGTGAAIGSSVAFRPVLRDARVIREQVDRAVGLMQLGQFDETSPFFAAMEDVYGREFVRPRDGDGSWLRSKLKWRRQLAESAGPWWSLHGIAIVSERPLVAAVDERHRLHADDGPAIAFPDGIELYAWHGVHVPKSALADADSITVRQILAERNTEVRRALLERYGVERFLRESEPTLVSEDECGRLWRKELLEEREPRVGAWPGPAHRVWDEPITMVEVVNSTPEPDGSTKTYFLRVPPNTRTARQGVAWTFGMTAEEYVPAIQT